MFVTCNATSRGRRPLWAVAESLVVSRSPLISQLVLVRRLTKHHHLPHLARHHPRVAGYPDRRDVTQTRLRRVDARLPFLLTNMEFRPPGVCVLAL